MKSMPAATILQSRPRNGGAGMRWRGTTQEVERWETCDVMRCDRARASDSVAPGLDGKEFDFEHRLLMPHGSMKHVHVVAHALGDDSGSIEFVGAVIDVTVAKEVETGFD
jgi:hypothetical protein